MNDFKKIFESHYTWIEGFMRNVRRYPEKTAIIDPLRKLTLNYQQLNAEVNLLSNTLSAQGFQPHDIVMILLKNCPEFVYAYIAAHKMHGVCCPVSFRLSAGELAWAMSDARPKVFIYDVRFDETVKEALSLSSYQPEHVIVVGGKESADAVTYREFVADANTDEPVSTCDYNIYDETLRLYTSGTTGRPKAVPLLSINEVLSAHDVMMELPMNDEDITMNTTPWFHRGGIHSAGPCVVFYAGASLVIMDKFNAIDTLNYVEKYHITYVIGVPTVLDALADEQEKHPRKLSSIRGVIAMGSPLEREACMRYMRDLTPNIFNGYGTTETFWNTMLRPGDVLSHAGSAGRSCVDDDVRVVKIYEDRKGEPDELVAMDGTEVGEVIMRSPAKSPYRYHNNDDASADKYYKGFVYTNDLATWDKDQFITILGRMDDMIISSGENIYPAEVEAVLDAHPDVKESIVTSVPDKIRGQIVTAYVVTENPELTPEDLDDFCKESPEIANFKRPRYYRFVDSIPHNATGKRMHRDVKKQASEDLKNGLLYRM